MLYYARIDGQAAAPQWETLESETWSGLGHQRRFALSRASDPVLITGSEPSRLQPAVWDDYDHLFGRIAIDIPGEDNLVQVTPDGALIATAARTGEVGTYHCDTDGIPLTALQSLTVPDVTERSGAAWVPCAP